MTCTLYVAWDERLAAYDFGGGHPMAPLRVELAIELARAFGLFAPGGVSVERPAPATDARPLSWCTIRATSRECG